mmetsp:Transcript_29589/g.65519  ORF Transcript_29589/g.65519 Transcript_29589/m.65519 type:complete len:448 (-) Transcript_29589:988-2331(-)
MSSGSGMDTAGSSAVQSSSTASSPAYTSPTPARGPSSGSAAASGSGASNAPSRGRFLPSIPPAPASRELCRSSSSAAVPGSKPSAIPSAPARSGSLGRSTFTVRGYRGPAPPPPQAAPPQAGPQPPSSSELGAAGPGRGARLASSSHTEGPGSAMASAAGGGPAASGPPGPVALRRPSDYGSSGSYEEDGDSDEDDDGRDAHAHTPVAALCSPGKGPLQATVHNTPSPKAAASTFSYPLPSPQKHAADVSMAGGGQDGRFRTLDGHLLPSMPLQEGERSQQSSTSGDPPAPPSPIMHGPFYDPTGSYEAAYLHAVPHASGGAAALPAPPGPPLGILATLASPVAPPTHHGAPVPSVTYSRPPALPRRREAPSRQAAAPLSNAQGARSSDRGSSPVQGQPTGNAGAGAWGALINADVSPELDVSDLVVKPGKLPVGRLSPCRRRRSAA